MSSFAFIDLKSVFRKKNQSRMHSSSWWLILTKHNCLLPPSVSWKLAMFWFQTVLYFLLQKEKMQPLFVCLAGFQCRSLERLTAHKSSCQSTPATSSCCCFLSSSLLRPGDREVRRSDLFTLRFTRTMWPSMLPGKESSKSVKCFPTLLALPVCFSFSPGYSHANPTLLF